MIRKETDPAFVNRIVNSPAVRPFVDFREDRSTEIDASPAIGRVTQTGIVWLSDGDCALACFEQTGDRQYRGDLFFGEGCRGRRAIEAGAEMLDWMRPYADEIWGLVPVSNPKALWYASALGFSRSGPIDTDNQGPAMVVAKVLH